MLNCIIKYLEMQPFFDEHYPYCLSGFIPAPSEKVRSHI